MFKSHKTWSRLVALFGSAIAAFAFAVVLSPSVFADTITGGAAATISADTNSSDGDGTYTGISNVVLTADLVGDFTVLDSVVLTAPTGFAFQTDAGGVTATPTGETLNLGGGAGTPITVTATATTITIPITNGNGTTAGATITVSSIAVVPTAAGDTLSTGSIAVTITGTGSSSFTEGNSSGVLTEVAGAFAQYGVTTANGTESVATPFTITVTPQDQFGNTQMTSASNSAVAITTNATTSPDGTSPVQDVAGTAADWTTLTTAALDLTTGAVSTTETFRLVDTGETPTITVTESGATSCGGSACTGTSSTVTVTAGAAAKLMIATLPATSAVVSQSFSTQPVVNVADTYGNAVTGDTSTVSAAVYSDSACSVSGAGTLSSNTKAAVAGVATFTNLRHNTAGTYYLGFADGALTAACTGAVSTIISGSASTITIVGASSGSSRDSTAPAVPSDITLSINSNNQVVITWRDPSDTDYSRIQILRGKNVSSVVEIAYAKVNKGLQTYTDSDVSVGDAMKYVLLVEDTSGNVSRSSVRSITVESGAVSDEVEDDNSSDDSSDGNQNQNQNQEQNRNRYQQAGVSESEVDSTVGAFSDLAKGDWHSPFIARLRNMNVLDGYSDGTIRPDDTINRAELAKIAAKSFGLSAAIERFADVPDDAWYAPFVGALENADATWTTTANFGPSEPVSRGEALGTLLSAAGIDLSAFAAEKLFPDLSTRHRFAVPITYAAQHGIVSGYDNGDFGAGDTLTRAQVAKIVALIKDL